MALFSLQKCDQNSLVDKFGTSHFTKKKCCAKLCHTRNMALKEKLLLLQFPCMKYYFKMPILVQQIAKLARISKKFILSRSSYELVIVLGILWGHKYDQKKKSNKTF